MRAEALRVGFGGVAALDGVDVAVAPGEVVGLVGANGAGKTTLLNCLSGHARPGGGRVWFDGADVTGFGPDARARRGLVRTFQGAELFPTMTVWDVLLLAQERTRPSRTMVSLLGLPGWAAAERARAAAAEELVGPLGLVRYLDHRVGDLSTGVRRVVDLACAIGLRPRLLLLDEPSAGLASAEAAGLGPRLAWLRETTGASIVIVEHDLALVWALADRIVVLEEGRVVAEGRPEELAQHPAVAFARLASREQK